MSDDFCVCVGAADHEDGEFRIGMEYSSRNSVVATIRSYTITKGVDYNVYEPEPQKSYAKCNSYGRGWAWLIRASLIRKKIRYNGRHTCNMGMISQDHSKLDSDTDAEAIRQLVELDPSMKVKSIIAEVQSRFNYTISYRKAWLAKQKSRAKEDSYQALLWWFSVMVQKIRGSIVQIEIRPLYNGSEEAHGVRILHCIFWKCSNTISLWFRLTEHTFTKNTKVYFWLLLHKMGTRTLCLLLLPS
ncbi:hypothetical protein Ahy_B08g093283 [Arachis hypogaea]|uniref:Transposase MuDR plant domain-containing protein n=1 Tax=Arachis hypogaea TaxID=3818 RepID=A0A444Y5W8_ARAHY|nr:hypothetical protein Ahy_B08g093283 [Arachis hypogaea]